MLNARIVGITLGALLLSIAVGFAYYLGATNTDGAFGQTELANYGQFISGFFAAIAVAFAAFGVPMALLQMRESRRIERESAAFAALERVEQLYFEHPEFARPTLGAVGLVRKMNTVLPDQVIGDQFIEDPTFVFRGGAKGDVTLSRQDVIDFTRYEWFVILALAACDEILRHSREEKDRWRDIVSRHVFRHREYIKGEWFQSRGMKVQSEALQNVILSEMKRADW